MSCNRQAEVEQALEILFFTPLSIVSKQEPLKAHQAFLALSVYFHLDQQEQGGCFDVGV